MPELFGVEYQDLGEEVDCHYGVRVIITRDDLTIDNLHDIACTAGSYYLDYKDEHISFSISSRIKNLDEHIINDVDEEDFVEYECPFTALIPFLSKELINKIIDSERDNLELLRCDLLEENYRLSNQA